MDLRLAGGDINRIRALAQQLVGLRPDIILASSAVATATLQRETRTIPIVFAGVTDPVARGIIARLDRPSGSYSIPTLVPHRFICPHLRRRPGHSRSAAWPLAARAQQQGDRARRIGVLMGGNENDAEPKARLSAFTQALADLGWTNGRDLRMDVRWGGGDNNRIRAVAQELVGLPLNSCQEGP
jgi:hypothetical protein